MKLVVNGAERSVEAPPLKRLLDVLREDLGLTGTKEGCGEGECGACSVLIDGELVNSCLVAVCQAEGADILTVEGIAPRGELTALQRCFVERGGAHAFLGSGTAASNESVGEAIAGNLCRCTGYAKIVEAIQLAAGARR